MTKSATIMRVNAAGTALEPEVVRPTSLKQGWVRVSVAASGVCNAGIGTAKNSGSTPGHEVAGHIAELGEGIKGWAVGDRVAVGWFGGSCGQCDFCRCGDVVDCAERKVPGLSYPVGWAESIAVPTDALVRIPEGLDLFDAAPTGCAGVTTFNAIHHAHLPAGSTLAVVGIGGLGHLAVQFAAKMGPHVIARGPEREALAMDLGARAYIDSDAISPGAALKAMGGADLIINTVPTTKPVAELTTGLRVGGRLTHIGVDGERSRSLRPNSS